MAEEKMSDVIKVRWDKLHALQAEGKNPYEITKYDVTGHAKAINYVTANITYDTEEAENVESGYIPDPDEVLRTKRGICLDYASLLCAMLRSQRIPTQLEVGYAGTVYHAWLSVYIDNIGWINGMIRFDGRDWTIMDPTFAANSAEKKLRKFLGDSSNYQTKYTY